MTAWTDAYLDRLTPRLRAAADPERAVPMARYMRDQFAFLGIRARELRLLVRSVRAPLPKPDEADLVELADRCWSRAEREYQYTACDELRRHARGLGPVFLPAAERLITTKSWWYTVDTLAAHTVGPIVRRHPHLRGDMDSWLAAGDFWLARSALLHQLSWKGDTDEAWLFAACRARAADQEFFIRKAIGWVLREHSKTAPDSVARFVADHGHELSGLSRREAVRRLPPGS